MRCVSTSAAANTAEVKAEASKPAEAPKAAAKSFEEQSGYAIGLSMGRYIANTLERQQELGIKLDNSVILKGVTDGLGKEAKMTDEEIQKVLQQYDAKINELTKAKADKDAVDNQKKGEEYLTANATAGRLPALVHQRFGVAFVHARQCLHGGVAQRR